jgi:hypothetical protein
VAVLADGLTSLSYYALRFVRVGLSVKLLGDTYRLTYRVTQHQQLDRCATPAIDTGEGFLTRDNRVRRTTFPIKFGFRNKIAPDSPFSTLPEKPASPLTRPTPSSG